MRALHCVAFALALSCVGGSALADTLHVKGGSVTFQAVGKPGFLKINGEGAEPKGDLTVDGGKASGTVSCDLSALKTGIGMRDEHMKTKYLETGKFPTASLKLDPVDASDGERDFSGALTLHGVTKPVKGKAKISAGTVVATFSVDVADFGIAIPAYMGVTVTQTVDVTVRATAAK